MKNFNSDTKYANWLSSLSAVVFFLFGGTVGAQQTNSDYAALPETSQQSAADVSVMLTLSVDHQLFIKAYNDYDDIVATDGKPYFVIGPDGKPTPRLVDVVPQNLIPTDPPTVDAQNDPILVPEQRVVPLDGVADITYQDGYEYVGYFDSQKCYDTNVAPNSTYENETFVVNTTQMTAGTHWCEGAGGGWSGNFLNWATMTRIDLVRFVLYGGQRSTDTATETVLERAFLPHDSHSFAKYLKDQTLINNLTEGLNPIDCSTATSEEECGYTFCNTTEHGTGTSHSTASASLPPLMRVVKGNYSLWASGERFQCLTSSEAGGWGANDNDPSKSGIFAYDALPTDALTDDYIVRVEVCESAPVSGVATSLKCLPYTDSGVTGYKPVGILHKYGIDEGFEFGLLTGSYEHNKSFGTLRKNVSSFRDEILPNGTMDASLAESIVKNINALKLVDYRFGDGTYNNNCNWGLANFDNGKCPNWGNPFSELLAASYRYFAGGDKLANTAPGTQIELQTVNASTGFTEAALSGLSAPNWDAQFSCSNMNVLGFNASSVSYDSDELDGKTVEDILGVILPTTSPNSTVNALTDALGVGEGIQATDQYFVGQVAGAGDEQCSAKAIGSLSQVSGTCPESPRLEGSYLGAGLAHYVHTTDLSADPGEQRIATYGVSLAGALPTIKVSGVTIIPSCKFYSEASGNHVGNCAIVDFRPIEVTQTGAATTVYEGSYLVSWEDSEQGGDYDPDLTGLIDYTITNGQLTIDTTMLYEGAGGSMDFGYIISGIGAQDGVYFPSNIQADQPSTPSVEADTRSADCVGKDSALCSGGASQTQTMTFTINTSVASSGKQLEDPLYYASKWGSFDEKDSLLIDQDNTPNQPHEWSKDGEPTGYARVTDPARLSAQIDTIFENLGLRETAATGAGGTKNTTTTNGLYIRSLFNESIDKVIITNPGATNESQETQTINWVGTFNGLFIDRYFNLREDSKLTGTIGILDDSDPVVEFYTDVLPNTKKKVSLARRYPFDPLALDPSQPPADVTQITPNILLDDVDYLWNVNEELERFANPANNAQRGAYTNLASSGRYIFTSIDGSNPNIAADSRIGPDEEVEFTPANIADLKGYLHLSEHGTAAEQADEIALIEFIRGKEDSANTGFRSRSLDGKPWLLGDIVHSSPVLVSRPADGYNYDYDDASYADFRNQHKNRRQVVYVGANDGMLHAFNAGFSYSDKVGFAVDNKAVSANAPQAPLHPLGSELWAYIPFNSLPHLKWLSDKGYRHVYFMDGNIEAFDVKIFQDTKTSNTNLGDHPGGWGTIIVAGMRFGGGEYDLDPSDYAGTNTTTMRSAYVVLDVTNPEEPPRVIAEITDPRLGYTTSNVKIAHEGAYASEWSLVFGSGPKGVNALGQATSDGNAYVFSFDLKGAINNSATALDWVDTAEQNSFIGGVEVIDWNGDFIDDDVYYGVVGPDDAVSGAQTGRLMQTALLPPAIDNSSSYILSTNSYAFGSAPKAVLDVDDNRWIFAATGRFYIAEDGNFEGQNTMFGNIISKAGVSTTPIADNELYDVTPLQLYVQQDGAHYIYDPVTSGRLQAGNTDMVLDQFNSIVSTDKGWKRDFRDLGEINFTGVGFHQDTLFVNTSNPDYSSSCSAGGGSKKYAWDMLNGMPQLTLVNVLSFDGPGNSIGSDQQAGDLIDEVEGVVYGTPDPSPDSVPQDVEEDGSKGKDPEKFLRSIGARRSWREISLDELY